MNFLTHISNAKREIMAADSLVKVKDLWNKSEAMRQLGQASKDPELINYATEFKLRCERRLGQLLEENNPHGINRFTRGGKSTIPDLGIDYNTSARAKRIALVSEETFEAVIAEAKEGERELTRRAVEKLLIISEAPAQPEPVPTPAGKFKTIIIDPPWPMDKILREVRPNQRVMDYPTMTLDDIKALPVADLTDPAGCHVYLWFTQKYRRFVFELFDTWGVKDECFMTWIKNVGFTPYSWMYSTEHVLFGRVGSLPLLKMGQRLDFTGKVREHSRKPDEFYDLVKQASPTLRLDFFSREKRDGFEQYGNEPEKFGTIHV
jgi:N6-adenosine-specific RNA methylase IME4